MGWDGGFVLDRWLDEVWGWFWSRFIGREVVSGYLGEEWGGGGVRVWYILGILGGLCDRGLVCVCGVGWV